MKFCFVCCCLYSPQSPKSSCTCGHLVPDRARFRTTEERKLFSLFLLTFPLYFVSTAAQETLMNALLKQIHNIPKSFNNSVGYTIKTDPPSRTMISLFNILTSPSKLVSLLHRRICVSTHILFVLVDPPDAQSWYLLGRAYMAGQKYNKAYEAFQQAVYRDGRNPSGALFHVPGHVMVVP